MCRVRQLFEKKANFKGLYCMQLLNHQQLHNNRLTTKETPAEKCQ